MAVCRACGKENPEDARFCNACGAQLAAAPAIPREVRKTVTVLFSDVTSSTALGERHDPESMRRVMGRWFDMARRSLERHGGTVEKFVGDAVMAVFGIPAVHEDDALRAVRAADELRLGLAELNHELERDFGLRLETRTGINTGEVVAGEGETLATGDAVNVAARLEQAAAPGDTLLGEQTLRLVIDAVDVVPVEPMVLKGKAAAVSAYRLLAVHPDAAGVGRRLDATLVGRNAELVQLRQAFERCLRNRTAVLATLLGPAGIGKSRLTEELLDGIDEEALILRSRCLPYGDGITYWPLLELFRRTVGDDLRDRVAALVAGDPQAELVADRLAAAGAASGGAADEIAWAARKLFEHLARDRPLVVVLDDLQWAEPTFLDLVDHVAELSRDAPIFLLCLARPELLEARPAWGGGKLNATTLLLEPLSSEEADELIERLLAGSELPIEARQRIAAAAEGNPLFVEQMLALVTEDGAVAEVVVPPTIQALLAARLDRLGREERTVVERASVEGKVFHQGAVAELVPSDLQPAVPTCLVALVRKELIRPDRAAFAGDEAFRFRHLLVRDAAYEALPKQERAELHERFASWLERAAGERARDYEEILGYHLEQAYRCRLALGPGGAAEEDLARRAASRLASSGRAALVRRDVRAASSLLSRAAGLLPEDDDERLAILPELADAVWDAGEAVRAEAVLAEAVERAEAAGNRSTAARARLLRLMVAQMTDSSIEINDTLQEAERIADEFERQGDYAGVVRALSVIGRLRFFRGEAAEAVRIFERALSLESDSGEHLPGDESDLRSWRLGAMRFGPMPVAQGIAACEEALRSPLDARLECFASATLATFEAMRGRFDEARALAAHAKHVADEFGQRIRRGAHAQMFSEIELHAGDVEAATRELREGHAILTSLGELGFRATVASMLADVLTRLGHTDEAERLVAEVIDIAAADDFDPQARWRAVRAQLLATKGEHAEAEQLAREAVALAMGSDYLHLQAEMLATLADVLAAADRTDEALEAAASAVALLERKENAVGAARMRARLEVLRTGVPPGAPGTIVAT